MAKKYRQCRLCDDVLPLDDFYYRANRGCHDTACKKCVGKRGKNNYQKSRECRLAYAKLYYRTKKGKEVNRKANRVYNKSSKGKASFRRRYIKDAEKVLARRILNHAVGRGDVTRAAYCESCGLECKTEGHHEDYSKPLNVTWLCTKCHKNQDKEVCYG